MADWGWLKDPELRKAVSKCLSHVKKLKEQGKTWEDFELSEVGVPYHIMRKLVYDYEMFEVTYKSRSHTFYKFAVPIEEVEKRLNESEIVVQPVVDESKKFVDVPLDFWEVVEGYDDLKELFLASIKSNDPVHILLIGPPSTGKSLILMEVERLAGSIFVTAGTMTRVGLRDILLNYKPRFLLIDELDKIKDPDDLSVLLTLMESGRVVVAKHNEYREEKMKTWVFASANTTKGLRPELLDRFFKVYLRSYDPETMKRVIVKTLTLREKVNKDLASYIAEKIVETDMTVRDAIRLARISKNKEDVNKYIEILKRYKRLI